MWGAAPNTDVHTCASFSLCLTHLLLLFINSLHFTSVSTFGAQLGQTSGPNWSKPGKNFTKGPRERGMGFCNRYVTYWVVSSLIHSATISKRGQEWYLMIPPIDKSDLISCKSFYFVLLARVTSLEIAAHYLVGCVVYHVCNVVSFKKLKKNKY